MLLDALHLAADLGQFFQAHQNAFLLAQWGRRRAEHMLIGRHVLGHTRLRADHRAVADMNVIHNANLTRDNDVIACAARPGDAHLADQQIVFANPTVVSDLHQVIDLRSGPNSCRLKRAAIHGRAGPDFDIIADLDMPELRDLGVLALMGPVAEAIGADHGVGVNNDAVAHERVVIEHGMRIKRHVITQPAATAHDGPAMQSATGANDGPRTDHGERMNAGVRTDLRGGMHTGERIDSVNGWLGPTLKVLDNGDEGGQRIGHANKGFTRGGRGGRRHDHGGPTVGQVTGVFDKGDVALGGLAERMGTMNNRIGTPNDFPLDERRELSDGNTQGARPFIHESHGSRERADDSLPWKMGQCEFALGPWRRYLCPWRLLPATLKVETLMTPSSVYAIATMDTKGAELAFVAERLTNVGVRVNMVDVGTRDAPAIRPDIARETVAACHSDGAAAVLGQTDRGRAVEAMSIALQTYLMREHAVGRVAGVIALGGSGGTALVCPALRALPIGLPKIMVSTVAGGNVAAYVGCSDIVMFPSVVDVAGLNRVSRQVLSNAAHALAGMVNHPVAIAGDRPAIGMTMFGVTTPCVDAVRRALEAAGFDCLVFHATGAGGRTMEKLVEAGMIRGVLDITTTEVADEVVGGVFPAGPERFDRILAAGVSYVMSLGALDMVNFGAMDTVPQAHRGRRLHVHNPQVTLMRTTPEENRQSARWMATKIHRFATPLTILIPEGGVSALDAPGQPFHDPEADAALFDELQRALERRPNCILRRLPLHINDPRFADALVQAFQSQWAEHAASSFVTSK